MPLVTGRNQVLDNYAEAAEHRWVMPCFCTENLTTTEAVLAATLERGRQLGREDLPICLGITNQYAGRAQSANYTHTHRWDMGLRLYLADLRALTEPGSPFAKVRVLAHLDHAQHDTDRALVRMGPDASSPRSCTMPPPYPGSRISPRRRDSWRRAAGRSWWRARATSSRTPRSTSRWKTTS